MENRIAELLLLFAVTLTVLALLTIVANAQTPCGPTGKVEARIQKEYGESIIGAGVVAGGYLFTTVNPQTGSFTVLLRRPDGQTCVLMGGTGYATTDAIIPGVRT
jgi:hypothetical protein